MDIQKQINLKFCQVFGRTPLKQRIEDILGEAIELSRFTDLSNLREELGDLISSSIQLASECNWKIEDLIQENLDKIERRTLQYRSMGRKINVALIGAAFNPPTLGHVEIAKYVLGTSKIFDEVFLMPCSKHMLGKKMESSEHRLAMCRLAAEVDPRIKVFDYEVANDLGGETYQTMKLLMSEDMAKHQYDFSFVIGMDNANEFSRWVNYEHLERLVRFVVVPRRGAQIDPKVDWFLKPPHIYLGHSDCEIREVSSTMVRELLQTTHGYEAVSGFIDERVYRYIIEHGLYKTKVS